MKTYSGGRLAAFAAALVLLSCDEETKSKSPPNEETYEGPGLEVVTEKLAPLAEVHCEWLFGCCNADELFAEFGPVIDSPKSCADQMLDRAARGALTNSAIPLPASSSVPNLLGHLDRLAYGLDQGRVTIDEEALSACVAWIGKRECNPGGARTHCEPESPLPYDEYPCEVRKIYVGGQVEGELCDVTHGDVDCAPGLRCGTVASPFGVCFKPHGEGEACLSANDCAPGLRCDSAMGACTKGLAEGEKCAFADPAHPVPGTEVTPCAYGLTCDTVTLRCTDERCAGGTTCAYDFECPEGLLCVAGRCGQPAATGEACYRHEECENQRCMWNSVTQRQACTALATLDEACSTDGQCESGHYCHPQSATCQKKLAPSEPCTFYNECQFGSCDWVDDHMECVERGTDGDACTGDHECAQADGFHCAGGTTCRPYPYALGVACAQDYECASGTCREGVCAQPGQAGDPCGKLSGPCAEGHYCELSAPDAAEGTCQPHKPYGAPCSDNRECAGQCSPIHGQLRCTAPYNNRLEMCSGSD